MIVDPQAEEVDEFGDEFGFPQKKGWQQKVKKFVSDKSASARTKLETVQHKVSDLHIAEKTRKAMANAADALAVKRSGNGQSPEDDSSAAAGSTPPPAIAANAVTDKLLAPPGPGDTTAVFGVPFEVAVQRSARITPDLPDVVTSCCAYLERRGLDEEGLFRLSGSLREVAVLRGTFQRGETPNLEEIGDPHVVSGLLKLYLRELPESLFTRKPGTTPADPRGPYKTLLNALFDGRRKALQLIFSLLVKVVAHSKKSKMNANNLAIVFSPTLQAANDVVVNLINNFDGLFDPAQAPRLPPFYPDITPSSTTPTNSPPFVLSAGSATTTGTGTAATGPVPTKSQSSILPGPVSKPTPKPSLISPEELGRVGRGKPLPAPPQQKPLPLPPPASASGSTGSSEKQGSSSTSSAGMNASASSLPVSPGPPATDLLL